MSTGKHIDKICIAVVAFTLVLTILFMCGSSLGLTAVPATMKYESTLFDTSYVHEIDIVMNDWDSFIESCEDEEYATCTVVIDGEKHSNIAIRAKGNTSLSNVKSLGSQRYSFKLEFDHNESGKTLDGLDKLCLNNLIQDNTMMKDYLVYQMMTDFGADSPLCSYAYLTVNGEDWGLYLAVEGIEDSFLSRTYGSDGELYKPDSLSFGGGRGNGKDFNMDSFDFDGQTTDTESEANQSMGQTETQQNNTDQMTPPDGRQQNNTDQMTPPDGRQQGGFGGMTPPDFDSSQNPFAQDGQQMPDFEGSTMPDFENLPDGELPDTSNSGFDPTQGGFGGMSGMGSDDVKLKYIDDDASSYSNIFDNAKTDVSDADQKRLIASLKSLSSYSDLENVLDTDEVLRYFVVHNFVCNGDSYTGSMIHNYYLHESDGQLSMIPWDYNLAFGTFQGGDASSSVNADIDSPVSGGSVDDRPMVGWIFSDESYTEQYHALFSEFLGKWFTNGELESLITETANLIRPYVEKDPTKFCTAEEFESGVTAITDFVTLRAEAVEHQLNGDDTAVDTSGLNVSDMGTMSNGGGGGAMPGTTDRNNAGNRAENPSSGETAPVAEENTNSLSMETPTEDGSAASGEQPQMPSGEMPSMPSGEQPQMPSGEMPSMPNGEQPQMPTGENSEMPTIPNGEANGDTPEMPNGQAGTMGGQAAASVTAWIFLGVSVLVLAVGLLIASKKKY